VSTDDDNPADDWANAPITTLDGQITPASGIDSVIEDARKRGVLQGQNEAVRAFATIMRWNGLTEDQINAVVAAARAEMRKPSTPLALPEHKG
jgi:hypothetical protein